jgi:transcription factor SPT20
VAGGTSKGKGSPLKEKTSEQKDKEAMPAPSAPPDGQNNMKASSTMRQSTIVLHPTAQTIQTDLALMAMAPLGVSDAVQDGVPPTPGAIPPTPTANSMPPPAKKQKREHAAPDGTNIYAVEGQILLAHYPQLDLEPARTVHDVITKLAAHAHPAHMEAPPQPKTRKRTVAEVAADEAQQAERERFMLTCDERLASRVPGAQGAANSGDGDGQGGAAWEPRYDNFQVIAELKQKAKEKAEREARENDEKTKKMEQDRAKAAELAQLQAQKRATEAGRQRQEEEIRARQKHVAAMQAKKLAQQQAQQQVQLQAQQQAQEQSQTQAQLQAQVRAQAQAHAQAQQNNSMNHGIPMQNAGMPTTLPNGMPMPATMAGQVQARFHQVSQAQASSPIVRQNSPQNMSSPMVGNVAMQHSTSSMGGSPPRPSSVVQNHQPMSVPMTASMSARGSQQSHQAGTPRMPTATPNMAHSTPISRAQAMQTPRMTQASPPPGMMTPGQLGQAHLMMNAQGMNPQMQNQQFIAAQMAQQQQRALQQQQQQQQQHNLAQALQQGFAPGQPNQSMTPQQLAQQQRLMQQQQALMQQRGLGAQQLTPQQYAQLQAMQNNAQLQQQLHGGQMQNPMQRQMAVNGQGMVNLNPANHAQMAMIRQMEQIRQQQALQIQQQQQQQAQQQQQHVQQQMGQQPQMQPAASQAIQAQIKAQQVKLYQTHIHQLIAQHGSKDAIPPQVHDAFTSKCFVSARNQVLQHLGNQNRMSQIAMMQQQQQRQQQAQAQVQGMQGMMPQDGM